MTFVIKWSSIIRAGNNIKGALIGSGVAASHGMERTHLKGVINTYELLKAYILKCAMTTWGIPGMMETFCISIASMAISWQWYCTIVFQNISIMENKSIWNLPARFCVNLQLSKLKVELKKKLKRDFPYSPVIKNPPTNTEDRDLVPGLGRFHMPWGN